ncbi:hypothetical protein SBRY_10962 [Actinacidiphila bryophytorum]|uniref:Uncharacterized protein n=2 Tax=Actinacidiphila bryophytorum TaxID=1436133 RepID=A0A9W4E1B7_9ACTN|nr:hypothetical protein SBRY_10962 [Actinacidiphila bryophytorum]
MPDEGAVREFVKQFNEELEGDPALRERFTQNPEVVLADRGLAVDLQRLLLQSSGVDGADEIACHITCFLSEICTTLRIGV